MYLILTTSICVSTSNYTEKQTLETYTQSFPQQDSFLLPQHRQAALQFTTGRNNKRGWNHPFHFRFSSSPLLRLTKLELVILMWLLHNSRWGPNYKDEKEKDGERGEMFGTFDFIANLMGAFLFMPRRKIYCAIDGDFNARMKQTNGSRTKLVNRVPSM